MKKKIIALFCICTFITANANQIKLAIFDTTHNEKYRYNQFIKICESLDYNVEYKSIAQIMDNKINLIKYDGILFIIDIEFLKSMAKSLVANKILNLIKTFSNEKNKLIGIALPTISGSIPNKTRLFMPIFKRIGLNINSKSFEILNIPDNKNDNSLYLKKINKNLEEFFLATNNFLDIPIESRGFLYHTTLKLPRKFNFQSYASKYNSNFCVLPIKHRLPIYLTPTLPYGIYFFNPIRKNHIFITSSSLLTGLGISENFHYCPTNFDLRKKILDLIQEMMWELKILVSEKNPKQINISKINKNNKPILPNLLQVKTQKEKPSKTIKIAWMEIYPFEKDDQESQKQQDLLVECILKSGSNLYLWITLNPHMYYSPIAKTPQKKQLFWKSLSLFTKKLKEKSQKLKIDAPKILIGYEITNNIYNPNLPQNFSIDMYETEYPDIPNPLDNNFWENEIKKPLIPFLEEWQKPHINNGIKIAGIVLDLEMYCRTTTGTFLDTMGFDQQNFNKYCQLNSLKSSPKNKSCKEQLNLLIKNQSMQKYFEFLQNQAIILGKNLKSFFCEKIKDCKIACYAPNISTNWFYKGFYRGLSQTEKPILLLTFNTDFNSHKNWLEKNKIYAKHLSVLMLSKLKNKSDFFWIDN
ncbi:hypothetical protein ACFLYH_01355, partial [Candidatus Dependentiae bacterium]